MTDRRFIEEHFPVREVGVESVREKNISHGHISALHRWWARRPLAASRATIYASLIPAPAPDHAKDTSTTKSEIVKLSRWCNPLDHDIVERAKKAVLEHHKEPPKVLDPFAGGGSIPLEALRLGCDTYATDYNPVSVFIVKAITEKPFQEDLPSVQGAELGVHVESLSASVKKWSQWVFNEAKRELAKFFPNNDQGEPVGYLWSRCIPCQNPRCEATVPLIKQFWLANTKKRKIALLPTVKKNDITFAIAGSKGIKIPHDFDPSKGTTSRGKATCLVCNYRMDGDQVKTLFAKHKNTESMIVVITSLAGRSGKSYTIATKKDLEIFKNASIALGKKVEALTANYNIAPIPNESLPPVGTLGFRVQRYGMDTWSDLFNDRQKLVLLTFMEKILEAASRIKKDHSGDMRAIPYLAVMLDRLAEKNATLCWWQVGRETVANVFSRHALPMVWDYPEVNPFTSIGWPNMEKRVLGVFEHILSISTRPAVVQRVSATALPFESEFFDAVITDPPYYDNVPYSHLSDFFYVWLKRTIGQQFPDLFSTPLTPKNDEVVVYSHREGGYSSGKVLFEERLKQSFSEIYRVLKQDGIATIVYAHKSTDGWETLINSLLGAGLVVTAAWPIHTEMKERLRSVKSAALLSSIYMVCRKRKKEDVGSYYDVKRDLKKYLDKKLDQLWNEGIAGADFFIASIGSAIEVYGKYRHVIDNTDANVPVTQLLEDTRIMVTDYAIDKVVRGEIAGKISQMTRFYVLWRWAHGEAKVPFDDARKLAQSVGIDLTREWGKGFVRKDKEFVRVVGPDERKPTDLGDSNEMIDILHHALLLWKGQKIEAANKFLIIKGYKHSEVMRRVAQAVSESLSSVKGSKEKDWIDGMFTGFGATSASLEDGQTRLDARLMRG